MVLSAFMGIEIARFPKGVPARNKEEMRIKTQDALNRGETIWEALLEGTHELNSCFPVDNVLYALSLTVRHEGTGFIRVKPRNTQGGNQATESGTPKEGIIIELNKPGSMKPITQSETKADGLPTGRKLVYALIRHVPGPPPPNH